MLLKAAAVASLLIATSASAEGVYLGGQLGWGTTHLGGISNTNLTTAINNTTASNLFCKW